MKKAILILFTGITFFSKNLSAIEKIPVPKQIEYSFYKEFGTVENVSWDLVKNMHIAMFSKEAKIFFAYFREDGTMFGTATLINIDQMPLHIKRSLDFLLKNYSITGALEFIPNEATTSDYFVRLENPKKRIIVRVYSDGVTEVITKEKKTNL